MMAMLTATIITIASKSSTLTEEHYDVIERQHQAVAWLSSVHGASPGASGSPSGSSGVSVAPLPLSPGVSGSGFVLHVCFNWFGLLGL